MSQRPSKVSSGQETFEHGELLIQQTRRRSRGHTKAAGARREPLMKSFNRELCKIGEHLAEGLFVCELRATHVEFAREWSLVGRNLYPDRSHGFSCQEAPRTTRGVIEVEQFGWLDLDHLPSHIELEPVGASFSNDER